MVVPAALFLLILTLLSPVWSQELRICNEDLWHLTNPGTSVVFDGFDFIYFLGGARTSRLNITDYSLEQLGEFSKPWEHGTAAADKDGNVFYLGGKYWRVEGDAYNNDVYKFERGNPEPQIVGKLTGPNKFDSPSVTIGDIVYLLGGGGLYEGSEFYLSSGSGYYSTIQTYNMTSNTATIVGKLPNQAYRASVAHDVQYVYMFNGHDKVSGTKTGIWKINPNTYLVKDLGSKLPFYIGDASSAIVDNVAYIIGGSSGDQPRHDDILGYDIESGEVSVLEHKLYARWPQAVYVKSQRRIYIFGEDQSGKGLPMCLDFPREVSFDCIGQNDGDYPHPADCTKFITCSNELAHERKCPPGLHFDEKIRQCNYPEEANCSKN